MAEWKLRLTPQGDYSHTPEKEADVISRIIMSYFPKQLTYPPITDGTAGSGGNTLNFARYFERVMSVEMSPYEFKFLTDNVSRLYQNNRASVDPSGRFGDKEFRNRITLIKDDIVRIWDRLDTGIIFLDPPWGGPEYKHLANVNLFLSGQDICKIVKSMLSFRPRPMVVLKVPFNFDDCNLRVLTREMEVRCDKYEIFRQKYNWNKDLKPNYNHPTYQIFVISNNPSTHPLRIFVEHSTYFRSFYVKNSTKADTEQWWRPKKDEKPLAKRKKFFSFEAPF